MASAACLDQLQKMGIAGQDTVISTNVRTRLDGFPRSNEPAPVDPGAAVYWEESSGERRAIAIDRYTTVADNLAAIAATLDALRAVERHGGATILQRAFRGFTALPAPGETVKRTWRQVFGIQPDVKVSADTLHAYRRMAAEHHTDRGGSRALMAEMNVAKPESVQVSQDWRV